MPQNASSWGCCRNGTGRKAEKIRSPVLPPDSGLPAVRILHPFFFLIRIIFVFFYGKIFGDQPVAKNGDGDEENDVQDGRPDALDEEEEEQGHSQRKDSRAHATLYIPRLSDKNVPDRYPPAGSPAG